jgi:hypothetical protein
MGLLMTRQHVDPFQNLTTDRLWILLRAALLREHGLLAYIDENWVDTGDDPTGLNSTQILASYDIAFKEVGGLLERQQLVDELLAKLNS